MHSSRSSIFVLGVMLAALPLGAAAEVVVEEGAAEDGARSLDTVTVTATRSAKRLFESPVSEAVVTQEEMERSPRDSIADALRDIPGVDVEDSSMPGMKRVRIRGESVRRVLLLIDGQEVTDHRTYGSPILIDNDIVERIEVIKGPHSVLYGSKAVGGVINIITKKGGDRPVQGTVSLSYDSAAEGWKPYGSLYGSLDGFSYRVYGAATRYDDRETPRGTLENSSFRNDSFGVWAGYDFGDHRVAASYDRFDMSTRSHTSPGTLTGGITAFQLDLPKRNLEKFAVFYDWANVNGLISNIHFDAHYQTIDRRFVQDVTVAPGFPFVDIAAHVETEDELKTVGGTLQVNLDPHPDHLLIVGVQALRDKVDQVQEQSSVIRRLIPPFTIISNPAPRSDTMTQRTLALFAQDEWRIAPDWTLTGGVRHQWLRASLDRSSHLALRDASDSSLVGAVSGVYTGFRNTALRASFGQGYVYPTLLQHVSGSGHGAATVVHANPDLQPETSNNFEIGARYHDGALTLDTSAYLTLAENYIASRRCTIGDEPVAGCAGRAERYYANANEARTWGLELSAQYAIAPWGLTPYVDAGFIRRTLDTLDGRTSQVGLPKLSARYGVRYDTDLASDLRFWADAYLRSASGAEEADLATGDVRRFGGWTTVNLALGMNYGVEESLRLALNLNNLTDKAYQPATEEMMREGRSFVLKLTADF